MRLIRLGEPGCERPAVIIDDESVRDVSGLVDDFTPEFFASGGIARLRRALGEGPESLPKFDMQGSRIGPPIARPFKLLCIGLNYRDHAEESGMAIPEEPVLFGKATNTIIGPNDNILIPLNSEHMDYEVELAVILGEEARYLPNPQAAESLIAGYSVSHDVSERHFQLERGGQWIKGKSCETFNPLGPWLVTADDVSDASNLNLSLSLNGVVQQSSSTSEQVFDIPYLIWYLSQFMVLEPGDVINTGTPAGVGLAKSPPRYLQDGDVIEAEISGLGRQRQVCRQLWSV